MSRLPKWHSIEDNIRSIRNRGNPLPEVPGDRGFDTPQEFAYLILQDTGADDPERILMLGDVELVRRLDSHQLSLGDGTFKVVPEIFFQLYTIHTKVRNMF